MRTGARGEVRTDVLCDRNRPQADTLPEGGATRPVRRRIRSPRIIRQAKLVPKRKPAWRLPPQAAETAPVMAGPAPQPRSPNRASIPYRAVPPLGRARAPRAKVPAT